jgi:2-oxo-4-hydroxy-4-carboxy--5-ureidoimidazoline (OHCU) decarboxylase
MPGPGPLPPMAELDAVSPERFVAIMAPLFEGAPQFLDRLAAARPFGSFEVLLSTARSIARTMPLDEQIELVDAHPRLGAPPASVSALSFVEQGYAQDAAEQAARDAERERARVAAELERARVAAELERLNAAYESRFGFRYCVFVAGRPRAALLADFEAALGADRLAELRRAIDAVIDIAADRASKLGVAAAQEAHA